MSQCFGCALDRTVIRISAASIYLSTCVVYFITSSLKWYPFPAALFHYYCLLGMAILSTIYVGAKFAFGESHSFYPTRSPYIRHSHIPPIFADKLPDRLRIWYEALESYASDLFEFHASWKIQRALEKTAPHTSYPFQPITARRELLNRKWMIFRLQPYPALFKTPMLTWIDTLYQAWRGHQRTNIALLIYHKVQNVESFSTPAEFSISELEETENLKFNFLPVSTL